jgi:hypothetical protein
MAMICPDCQRTSTTCLWAIRVRSAEVSGAALQAITAMVLAERLAVGFGDDDLFVIGWREELGL